MRCPFCSASGGGQRSQHSGGETEIEPDAQHVTAADARAGEDQQPMLWQCGTQLVDDRQTASRPLSMIERPPITTTFSHGSSGITGRSRGRTSSRSSKVWRINGRGHVLGCEEDSDCERVSS